jgi:hypothetical protein
MGDGLFEEEWRHEVMTWYHDVMLDVAIMTMNYFWINGQIYLLFHAFTSGKTNIFFIFFIWQLTTLKINERSNPKRK